MKIIGTEEDGWSVILSEATHKQKDVKQMTFSIACLRPIALDLKKEAVVLFLIAVIPWGPTETNTPGVADNQSSAKHPQFININSFQLLLIPASSFNSLSANMNQWSKSPYLHISESVWLLYVVTG